MKNFFFCVVTLFLFNLSWLRNSNPPVITKLINVELLVVDYFARHFILDAWQGFEYTSATLVTAQKNSFSLRISSVDVTDSAVSWRFGHIY